MIFLRTSNKILSEFSRFGFSHRKVFRANHYFKMPKKTSTTAKKSPVKDSKDAKGGKWRNARKSIVAVKTAAIGALERRKSIAAEMLEDPT